MTIHELTLLQRRAFAAQNPWPVEERIAALESLHAAIQDREEAIYAALEQDLGKSPGEAYMTEIGLVLSEISYFIKHLEKWTQPKRVRLPLSQFPGSGYVLKESYGVVLIMAPWNYPFQLNLMPFIGALAAGNCCIVKPSAYAPATAQLISTLLADCFPPERAAAVLGGREENQALLEERFDLIFFTGSPTVGRLVLQKAARYLTPVVLELGGKSPCIVDDSANIAVAARRIAFGKAINAGQTCVAPDYLLVQERIRDKLLAAIRACWNDFYGLTLTSPQWPRMINPKHYDRVMRLIQGEKVYCGGVGDGQKIAPTILTDVSWDSPVMQEEIFGPVLPVLTFDRLEDVIPLINSREKPLALYLFSQRQSAQEMILTQVPFGGGCVNDTVIHLACDKLPFGGVGASGMGRYHGKYSFDTFTHEKAVARKGLWPDLAARYAPFTRKKTQLIKKLLK